MKSVGQKILQLNHFQVIRNEDSALEVLCRFTGIIFFTCSERFLLRMIQDKILYNQFLRQLSGIKCRAVAFLVRLERIAPGTLQRRKKRLFFKHAAKIGNHSAAGVKTDKTELRLSRGNGDFGEAGNRQAFQLFQLFQLFQIGFHRTISLYRDSITT